MSKKDYSDEPIVSAPLSENYKIFTFSSSRELLEWAGKDNDSLELSHLVFNAIVECLENEIDSIIVATLQIDDGVPTEIDVLVRRINFQKILSAYVTKLLNNENYEKLSEVKDTIEKWGLEFPE